MPDIDAKLVSDLSQIGETVVNGGRDLVTFNEARNRGNALAADNQILQDRLTLTPFQFGQKHGPRVQQLLDQADQGNVALGQYMKGATRDGGQAVSDTVIDAATGFNNAVGGIGVLGAGLVNRKLGIEASELLSGFTNYTRRNMSDYIKRNEHIEGVRAKLDEQDNSALYDRDVSEGEGSLVAGLKYIGRDILGAGSRIINNPSALKSTVAQGVGSLMAAGPVGKALGAAGVGVKAATPTAIGLMEGGGSYSGTVQDIMSRSHEELMQSSPDYAQMVASGEHPEIAKERIAHNAGVLAASIQGPVGAVLGKGVAAFEAAPLASRPIGEAVGNLVREGIEESAQGFTGQLAQNIGTRFQADPDQGLFEGAGSQAVLGAVGGIGAAGVTQAPNVTLRSAAKAAGIGLNYLKGRGERVLAENEKESAVSPETLAPLVEAAVEQAPAVGEAIRTLGSESGAKSEDVEAYIARVQQASLIQEQDLDILPDAIGEQLEGIQSTLGRMPNRFEVLHLAGKMANDEAASQADRVSAASFILKMSEDNKKLFQDDFPAYLKTVPHDRQEFKDFDAYAGILSRIENTPAIQQAMKWAREDMQMPEQDLSGVDLNSDDGRKIVGNMINVATTAPHAVDPVAAAHVLQQADSGTLELSPEHRRILRSTNSLHDSARLYAARSRVPELGSIEQDAAELNKELSATENRDEMLRFIGKQIKTEGGPKANQLSLSAHVSGISQSVSQGDMKAARRKAQHLVSFAQSHINKVGAINQSIRNGDGKNVPYQAFSSNGGFYEYKKGWGVIVGNAGSERAARTIHAEAQAIAQLSNDIIKQYPEFGIRERVVPELILDKPSQINKENITNNGDKMRGSSTRDAAPKPSQATTSRTVDDATQLELPLPLSQPAREPTNTSPAVEEGVQDSTDRSGNTSSDVISSIEPVPGWAYAPYTEEEVRAFDLMPIHGLDNGLITDKQFLKNNADRISIKDLVTDLDRKSMGMKSYIIDPEGKSWIITGNTWDHTGFLAEAAHHTRNKKAFANSIRITASGDQLGIDVIGSVEPNAKQIAALKTLTGAAERSGNTIAFSQRLGEALRTSTGGDRQIVSAVEQVPDETQAEESTGVSAEIAPLEPQLIEQDDSTVEDTGPKSLAETYPSLVQPKGRNRFLKSFRFPKTPRSRLVGIKNPIQELSNLLQGSVSGIVAFMGGKKPRYSIDSDNYQDLLELGDKAMKHVVKRLKDAVGDSDVLARIDAGDENLIRTRNNRVLNILEKTERGFRYNRELMETAAIASLDWVLNIADRKSPVDAEEVAKIMGIEESDAANYVDDFQRGLSLDMAKRSLGEHIRKFWGVESNTSARKGFTEGIPESVAAEYLHGLESVGLLELRIKKGDVDNSMTFPEVSNKRYNRVWFDANEKMKKIFSAFHGSSQFLADLVLIDREVEGYSVGEVIDDVDRTQLHNPNVKLSRKARKALRNAQQTPYKPNERSFDLYEAMGEEDYVRLMSRRPYKEGDLGKTHVEMGLNTNDWKSIQGKQRGLASNYTNVAKMMAASRAQGKAALFFKHHINKLGRPQMDGMANPQTSKFSRAVFTPMESVLDLSDKAGKHYTFFMKTIGQGIGLKTELLAGKEITQEVTASVMTEGGKYYALLQELKTWVQNRENGKGNSLPRSTYDLLYEANLTEHGVQSLVELARYELARDAGADLSRFETPNYLEADGKTNGPINAMMLFASGVFTRDHLRAVAKGGAFIGKLGKTLNSHEDKEDLYKGTSVVTQTKLSDLGRELERTNPDAHKVFEAFQRIMGALNANVTVGADGSVTLDRNLTKNPLTITVYGSGPSGIAGKITAELTKAIYGQISESIRTGKSTGDLVYTAENGGDAGFMNDLVMLTSQIVSRDRKSGYKVSGENTPFNNKYDGNLDLHEFTLSRPRSVNLRNNMQTLLVTPMVAAIEQEVTKHVLDVTKTVQQATQIQSIIHKSMFIQKIADRIALMKSDPEAYDYVGGEFLSEDELDVVWGEILKFSPIIDTGTQSYMLSGGETTELFDARDANNKRIPFKGKLPGGKEVDVNMPEGYSRSLTNDLAVKAHVRGATNAGVSSIPTLTVGSGDGQMMMNFLSEHPEAAKRVLHVFDGLNMPADAIEDYSRLINESVFKTWTSDKNPVRAVFESFAAFLESDPVKAMFPDGDVDLRSHQVLALEDLSRVYHNQKTLTEKKPVIKVDVARNMMKDLLSKLEHFADDTDIRRQVYSEMPFSVDHMASGEAPFVNEGTIKLPENATDLQILDAMNARRDELWAHKHSTKPGFVTAPVIAGVVAAKTELIKTTPKVQAKAKSRDLATFVNEQAFHDGETGAKVLHARQLANLDIDMTDTQREMLEAAVENLRKDNYTIVFGTESDLDRWEQVYNADIYQPGSNRDHGKMYPDRKQILISNIRAETLIHELIHAATYTRILEAHNNPDKVPAQDREAVARLYNLMNEWLDADPALDEGELNADHMAAHHIVFNFATNKNRPAAINEFMAWVLANQHLSERASQVTVKNPLSRIIGDALKALKALIFGKTKVAAVGDDILSNLRFNTRILMAAPSPVTLLKQDFRETVLHQSRVFGSNDRLTFLRESFNNKIIAWMNEDTGNKAHTHKRKLDREQDITDAERSAEDVTASFAHKFPELGNMQARSTFSMIQTALMTEIELNPNALSRIADIHTHVMKSLVVEDFMVDRTSNDPNDRDQAKDKFDVLNGIYTVRTDKHGRSSLMSAFLALAMTDEGFRKILHDKEKPKADRDDSKTMDAVLENTGNSLLNSLSMTVAGEGKTDNVRDALDRLTASMIENVGDQRSFIEQRGEGYVERAEAVAANKIQEVSGKLAEKSADIARNSNSRAVKAGATLVNVFSTMINEQKSSDAALGMVGWLNRNNKFHIIRDTVGNVMGRTKENALIFDMISKVRAQISQIRQNFRDNLPAKLASEFKKNPTAEQWTAMFKALGKTDIAALTSHMGVEGALEMISAPQKLAFAIKTLENSIRKQDPQRFNQIQAKTQQLGHYMVTGQHGTMFLRNAEIIARLPGSGRGMSNRNPPAQLIAEIDRLASLYAIQGLDQKTRDAMKTLLQDELVGVRFVTDYLVGQRVDELGKIGGNMIARLNYYKGHIPSEVQQGGSLIIASATEHAHLVGRGYKKVYDYDGSTADRVRSPRAYYFAPVSSLAPFSQGVMQTVHQTASGVDPETGYTVDDVMAGRVDDAKVVRLLEQQIANQRPTRENLLPVFDENMKVVAFERAADVSKLKSLNRSTDLSQMIGVWRGRQAEELLADQSNKELVDNLHTTWQRDLKAGKQAEYVNIARLGSTAKDDPVLIEAANLIPHQTREYIKEVYGPEEFWVRRDMLLDTFGARQASVGDLFTGKTRWHPKVVSEFEKLAVGMFSIAGKGNYAYSGLVSAEKNVQELVANAKNMIVVKSVIVPAANMVSNMFQLLNRGVPLRHILKGVGAKTAEINDYIKRRHREINLEADLRAATGRNDLTLMRKLENEIRSIQDSYRRMSIWPLIEAGEFSAISNGQVTAEDLALADGKWTGWVERKAQELPVGLRTAARYGLVTRDTALFQGLARSVQYGDFVAKAILYDDLTKRKKAASKEAVATVNEAFVNYNHLAGRDRQYLESVGLLWFWNYKLRIMKEAVYMLRHNPLRSLLMVGVPVGAPITDNLMSVLLDDRLGFSIGPAMGWNSLSLNPWINMAR